MTPQNDAGAVRPAPQDAPYGATDDTKQSTPPRRRDKWEDEEPLSDAEAARLEARVMGDAEEDEEDEWDGTPPPGIMPPGLEAFCNSLATAMNVDTTFTVALAPAVAAGLIGRRRMATGLDGEGHTVPTILWHCVIADRGMKKSHVLSRLTMAARERNSTLQADHDKASREWETVNKGKKTDAEAPTPRPILRFPVLDKTTMEAMRIHLEQPAVLLAKDELKGLFAGANMYRNGKGDDDDSLLELRSGGGFTLTRAGKDGQGRARHVSFTAASIVGTIQPERAIDALGNREAFLSGLTDRFGKFLCRRLPMPDKRPGAMPPWVASDWDDFCNYCLELDAGDPLLPLSNDAAEYYWRWRKQYDPDLAPPRLTGMYAKLADTIGPLAVIFTLWEDFKNANHSRSIGVEAMRQAVAYGEWTMHHNSRFLAMAAGTKSSDAEADRVLAALEDAGGELPQGQLRDALGWKSPSLSKVLARMGRAKTITITEEPRRGDRPGGRRRRMVRLIGGAQ